jgi:hypothetical protein
VLAAPPPAVVLILTDRDERLAACAARPRLQRLPPPGRIQAVTLTLAVLPVREREAVAAPPSSAVRGGTVLGECAKRLSLAALGTALLRQSGAECHTACWRRRLPIPVYAHPHRNQLLPLGITSPRVDSAADYLREFAREARRIEELAFDFLAVVDHRPHRCAASVGRADRWHASEVTPRALKARYG